MLHLYVNYQSDEPIFASAIVVGFDMLKFLVYFFTRVTSVSLSL